MMRRPKIAGNLTVAAALLFTLILVWTVRWYHAGVSASSFTRAGSTEGEVDRNEVRRITPQHPLGVVPNVPLIGSPSQLSDIQNSTLGFQKIFILSMPNRSDKRDALVLSAYLTGLDIEFIDGVNASLVPPKAYPENWDPTETTNSIGTWRGHMQIYQKIVRERIQTAIIMEDDVDWDVMIKAQMTEFARGTRYLQRSSGETHSPYGDGWDILSTGHCGLGNKLGEDQEYWVSKDDATVVPPARRWWGRTPNLTPSALTGNYTRLVFSPYKLTCLASYAVSLPGAARILYDQSVLPNGQPIDMGLSHMCARQDYRHNSCLGAYPMITGVHRPAGDMSKDSDRSQKKGGRIRKDAVSHGLVFPVRLNLAALLRGETVVKAQLPEHALVKEINTDTFQIPHGAPVFIRPTEYIIDPSEIRGASNDTETIVVVEKAQEKKEE